MEPIRLSPEEYYYLGYMYYYGEDIEQDDYKAFKWLYSAASRGYVEAYYLTGYCLLYGIGVETCVQKGLELLEKSAKEKNYDAAWTMAEWYYHNDSPDLSIALLKYAAKGNHPTAVACLGHLYDIGYWLPMDKKKAFKLYKKAADLGVPVAMWNLGLYYEKGIACKKDLKKAFKLFLKAGDEGLNDGYCSVGFFYAKGLLGKVEPDLAFIYFDAAAADGKCAHALYNLARCFEEGFGVEKDLEEAKRLKEKAYRVLGDDKFVIS